MSRSRRGHDHIGALDSLSRWTVRTCRNTLLKAFRDAAPAAINPSLAALQDAYKEDSDTLSAAGSLPTLTVVAGDSVVDTLTSQYHPASRLAALVEAGALELRSFDELQPNPVLAGASDGCVLVTAAGETDNGKSDSATEPWCRVGSDATLRDRYDALGSEIEPVRLRTPNRHAFYVALCGLCRSAVANDAVRLLDAGRDSDGPGPLDRSAARRRVDAAGAREGALDRNLRRACADAGLGSAATFTQIKSALVEAGLVTMDWVSQPVGRARHRLVARGALAEASSETAVLDALAKKSA